MAYFPIFGATSAGGWLSRNSDTLLQSGIGLLSGRNANEQAAMGLQGFQQGARQNKTAEWLSKNAPPELAQAVQAGVISPGDAYKTLLASKTKRPGNLLTVGKNLYNSDTEQWISPPAGAGGDDQEYGLNPQYGVDANGNPVILQLSKGGTSKQTALPDGVTLSKEPIRLDAGTHFVLLDPITRQPVGQIPKNVSGAAEQTADGKALSEAKTALPSVQSSSEQMLATIDSLARDPYLGSMLGPFDSRTPNLTSDAARVQGKMDQINGQAFLQAFNMLKGGGAITEIEGQKATQAMARLNAAQSEKDYIDALNDLRGVIERGVANARAKAGVTPAAPTGLSAPPATGANTGNRTSTGTTWRVK